MNVICILLFILPIIPAYQSSEIIDAYVSELEKCLKIIELIPANISSKFDVAIKNKHIELTIHNGDKFDYYEMNLGGYCCFNAIGLNEIPIRTEEEQRVCDMYIEKKEGQLTCPYYIVQENSDIVMGFCSNSYSTDVYKIHNETGELHYNKYGYRCPIYASRPHDDESEFQSKIDECLDKRSSIPENLPISFDITKRKRHIEILVHYKNKFDFYKLNWEGVVCLQELSLRQKPNDTEIGDSYRCDKPSWKDDSFDCAYDIWTTVYKNDDYVVFYIKQIRNGYPGAYAYIINTSTNKVDFYDEITEKRDDDEFNGESLFDLYTNKTFETTISNCVNEKRLIPDAMNASIIRISDHIRITVDYQGKYDYYQMNYEGLACYAGRQLTAPINRTMEDAARECETRNLTSLSNHRFRCGFNIVNPANDQYAAFNVLSDSIRYPGSYTYLLDKLTNDVEFRRYEEYNVEKIFVKRSESEKSFVYAAQFEECLNLRYAIPSDIPLKFNVTKADNHLNILVYDDGKYDYYEHNVIGEACHSEVRKGVNPTRSLEEQLKCGAWSSQLGHPSSQIEYRCGYEVIKNKTDVVILVQSSDGVYEYNVDRSSGKSELYLYRGSHIIRHFPEEQIICQNKQYASDFHIPLELEVKLKTEPRTIDDLQHPDYLEISVQYQGKYDLYVTEETGRVRYTEMQLTDRPNPDTYYSDKIRCKQEPLYRLRWSVSGKSFRCPLKVVENENYVNVSVNAFHYDNVYTIDKLSNETKYFKTKDNFLLSKPDAELSYNIAIDECRDRLLNVTGSPFPIDVVRHKNFLQISVGFNGTFDIYETMSTGIEMCQINRRSIEKPSQTGATPQWLEDVYPDCVSCDEPEFTFECPSFRLTEKEHKITLVFEHFPQSTNTYGYLKSSGDVYFHSKELMNAMSIPTLLKTLVG